MTEDEKDSVLRALNESAIAKHSVLSGAGKDEILRHLDASLSWTYRFFGKEHPMFNKTGHSSQCVLLRHEDILHEEQIV